MLACSHPRQRFAMPAAAMLCLLLILAPRAAAAQTRVTLEVLATDRFAITNAQAWARELGELGFASVRIRLADASQRPRPELTGEPGDASRKAIGVLTANNTLVLPGATFRRGDAAEIRAWLKRIAENTPEPEAVAAFGLSPEELVAVHTQLAAPLPAKTQGVGLTTAAGAIARQVTLPISVSETARQRLAGAEPVRDELQGLSSGTALAAVLRPLGVGFAPVKEGGAIRLVVDDFRNLPEAWPIGWPLQEKEVEVVPKLMEFLPVEINETPLADTVAAISGRLDLPVLYDHNAMARHRIDPWSETSSLPETRTYYRRILDRTLLPAGLKAELRLDEAEKPFLWIATLKR